MRLCLFTPLNRPVRGWVGAIEGDHVVHLAAQSLGALPKVHQDVLIQGMHGRGRLE